MIGDHHGWTVRRATLLVTATDEILGTHRLRRPVFGSARLGYVYRGCQNLH
jgi:hypothetical protein